MAIPMFTQSTDIEALAGCRVEVYWNLHRRCWSIREAGGRVIAHATCSVALRDVRWVVQPAGNRRAREEGRKNVHAFARGYIADRAEAKDFSRVPGCRLTYNPYRDTTFVCASLAGRADCLPVSASEGAFLRMFRVGERARPNVFGFSVR